MKYPLPWKAVEIPGLQPGKSLWDVTNDAGDPREEYSVTESMDERTARFIAEACNNYGVLKARVAELEAVVHKLLWNFPDLDETLGGQSVQEARELIQMAHKAMGEAQ